MIWTCLNPVSLSLGLGLGLRFLAVSAGAEQIIVPKDTPVRLVVSESISSANRRPGQTVELEVADDVIVKNLVVVRRGSHAWGVIGGGTKPASSLARRGELELSVTWIVCVTGNTIPVRRKQSASGESCGEGCLGVLLVPWIHGTDAVLRTGTKFYVFVREDVFLERSKVEQRQQQPNALALVESSLTIFRCRETDGRGYPDPSVQVSIDRKPLVTLQSNRFLSVFVPDGIHIVAVGKQNLRINGAFGSRYYVRVSSRGEQHLWLESTDDCDDEWVTLAPEDWNNIAREWQVRQ
jgi:hypothetical protein